MAMLPGVECARRRRIHQSKGCFDSPICPSGYGSTRRSSHCLYVSNNECRLGSISSTQRRTMNPTYDQDEDLEKVAREAKGRLDERLRANWKSDPKSFRINNQENFKGLEGKTMILPGKLQFGPFKLKKNESGIGLIKGSSVKAKEDCAICLDQFKTEED